jgi:hypothetical protein
MGLIEAVLFAAFGLLMTILVPVAARLITDDIKEWLPWLKNHLIERAVRRLPESERERYAEEWRSHVNETPGDLSRIVAALGFGFAAKSITNTNDFGRSFSGSQRAFEITISMALLLLMFPLLLALLLGAKIAFGSVFSTDFHVGSDGKPYRLRKIRTEGHDYTETNTSRFIRQAGIDKLPYLVSVVLGDIKIVGVHWSMNAYPLVGTEPSAMLRIRLRGAPQ